MNFCDASGVWLDWLEWIKWDFYVDLMNMT